MRKFNQSFSVMFIVGLLFLGSAFSAKAQNNLTGTYQLDSSRSDNVQEIVNDAINRSSVPNRDEAKEDLRERLESPPDLAIQLNGTEAIIASTMTQQITFTADGQDQTQTLPDGSTMRVRTTLRGQQLTVSSLINNNDYTIVFNSINNGTLLKVTRRMTTDYLSETVFTESVYTKTDAVARFERFGDQDENSTVATNDPISSNDPMDTDNDPVTTTSNPNPRRTTGNNPPTTRTSQRIGQSTVPNGEILTGTLENLG